MPTTGTAFFVIALLPVLGIDRKNLYLIPSPE